MKVVECRGTDQKIGETIGESLRAEIREHVENYGIGYHLGLGTSIETIRRLVGTFVETTSAFLPDVMEQMLGIARGAGISEEDILVLNLPSGGHDPHFDSGCTNVVFKNGPDGPLWGKNNDGGPPGKRRPNCILKIHPDQGIPIITVTFAGWLMGGDLMNAEGVAIGSSSVGSKFMQSPHHVSAMHWMYCGMFSARSAHDVARHLMMLPLRGKGYSSVAVDKEGHMFSVEAPCPLVQIRWPEPEDVGMNCVNCFQLPLLRDVTNRTEEMLANANGRRMFLEEAVRDGDRSIEHMQSILRHHGDYSLCRHGGNDMDYTEYSMIGIPGDGRLLFIEDNPCKREYKELRF